MKPGATALTLTFREPNSFAADFARPSSPAKKRKKPDEDVVPVPRSPKKSKLDVSPAKIHIEPNAGFDFGDIGEVGESISHFRYLITANDRQHIDAKPLSNSCHS